MRKKSWARLSALFLSVAMVLTCLPLTVWAADAVPTSEYVLDADGVDSGAAYAIYTNVESNAYNRILYHTGAGMTDKVQSANPNDPVTDRLPLNASFAASRQLWVIDETEGGYTVKSVDSGRYLDLTEASGKNINTSADAVVLQIARAEDGTCTISQDGASALSYDGNGNIYAGTQAASLRLFKQTEVWPEDTRSLEDAKNDPATEVYFLTGTDAKGGGWIGSTDDAAVQLYELSDPDAAVSGTSAVRRAGSVATGNRYSIRGEFGSGSWRNMHISTDSNTNRTNQCGSTETSTALGCGGAHLFTFTVQADGTYTISNGGLYLTQKAITFNNRDQFSFDGSGAQFHVTSAGETGFYYIWWETEKAVVDDGVYTPEQAVEDGKTVKYLTFTGGDGSSRWWDISGAAGDTAKIHLYKAAGAGTNSAITLDTDGIEAGNYVVIFGPSSNKPAVMHYSAPATNQCSSSTTTVSDTLHLFAFAAVDGTKNGFTISPYTDQGKYLSLDASDNQRLFKDEKTTFYVNPVQGEQGKYYLWIAEEPEDYSKLESARTVFTGTTAGEPFSTGDVGTRMFRIPAFITLDNGWLVAAADVRWANYLDNPANLDTIVSVSKDGGKTWEWEVVNYFGDYANDITNSLSAAFIDPVLVQADDGKVWMAIDVTAADGKSTAGSTGYDSQNRILVAHAPGYVGGKAPTSPGAYTYYVDDQPADVAFEGKTLYAIRASSNDAESGYAVDAFMNLYKVNGGTAAQEWCKQEGSELKVQTNLFYKQSAWKVFPTCFIMLRSATVTGDGLVWDDPIFPNLRYDGQTQPFFGVCPGRGTVTEDGRIIFPVYDNATGRELTSAIYSDDNGATWQRGARTSGYGNAYKTSESQIITLPDGTLRMYSRSEGSRAAHYTDSTDGSRTWGATQLDSGLENGSNCMFSVINVAGTLKGPNGETYENVVMASYPEGNGGYSAWGNRSNGSLRLGYISGSAGNWTINWLGEPKLYHGEAGTYFAYSCLTQYKDEAQQFTDKFGVLYEPNDNSYARPNLPVDLWYKEFNVAYVLGEGWSLTPDDPIVPDPEPHFPTAEAGQSIVYQQVTEESGLLSEGTLYAIVDDTPYDNGSARILYHAEGSGRTDQLGVAANEMLAINGGFAKERQLWTLIAVEGGYKLKSWDDGLYLSADASGNQLAVNAAGSVFTMTRTENGSWYLMSGGKYLDFSGNWKMVDAASALKVYAPTAVAITGDPAQTVFTGTADKPMSQESTGSSSFRIPALTTLSNGWIVAASDIRWRTTADSPQNLDTVVSVSKDGGETWEWEVVNYWADMANAQTAQSSASFIDPSIVQDKNGTLHMIVDACPSYVGLMGGNKMGEACTGFDSQGRMLVAKGTADADAPTSKSAYTYYVDLNAGGEFHPICAGDGTATDYSVDAFLNLYRGGNHEPVMCLQMGSDKIVQSNLFYRQSEWKAFPTFFIMHRTATVGDDGLVWSDPQFLNIKNDGERFLGVCPGRGTVAEDGRILFPLYDNATGNELASVIYSDDNGATWTRGERAGSLNGTGKSSESQIVRLPDGTLRMYSRNTLWYIGYADSTDNGATWGQYRQDSSLHYGYNVMVSFINLEGKLTAPDGTVYENLILASYPWGNKASEHNRSNGVVRIGSIGTDANHTVTWLNTDDIRYEGRYNYSCLTQLLDESGKPTGRFGLLYEKDRDNSMDIHFRVLTVADLLGEGCSLTVGEESHVHTWNEGQVTVQPTCTQAGEMTYTCACGETRTEEIAALGHSFADGYVCDESGHWHECVREGCTAATEKEPHTVVVDAAVEPTYETAGLTEGSHCSVCEMVIVAQEVIPALTPDAVLPIVPEIVIPGTEEIEDPDAPLAELPFVDVDHEEWYAQSIANVVAKGLMEGVEALLFAPEDAMTRGMTAQALYALAQKPEVTDPASFLDLADGVNYADAVAWGAETGVIKGYSETEFGGEDVLNRQQLATLLYRYAQLIDNQDVKADAGVLEQFSDHARVSAWAKDAMAWAVANELVIGRTDGALDPRAVITRAEAAAILDRYSKLFLA